MAGKFIWMLGAPGKHTLKDNFFLPPDLSKHHGQSVGAPNSVLLDIFGDTCSNADVVQTSPPPPQDQSAHFLGLYGLLPPSSSPPWTNG